MIRLVFDQKEVIAAWVARQVEQTASWGDFYAMGAEENGTIIAGIVFNGFNGVNATCHIAVNKSGRYLIDLLRHGADYAFLHCGLKRLTGLVESDNAKAIKLDLHMGFEREFTMRQAGSKGQDIEVLVLWPESFRYWTDEHKAILRGRSDRRERTRSG
jgi:RimJ/RimL family protein N-acetyltransferase